MKVRIGDVVIEVPTRKDHLLKVPREVLALHREDVYRKVKDEKEFLEAIHSRAFRIGEGGPEVLECSGILCDACGNPLMTAYVWLLILGGTAWGNHL